MSSTSNSQNLLVNVFRPVYTYSAGSGFTPRLVLSNVDILSAGAVQTGNFQFGDSNNNLFIGSNAGGGSNNASNVGIGVGAMNNKTNSTGTVAIGTNALQGATSAVDTIAVGSEITGGGTSNVILGARSGTVGSNMILLGPGLATTGDVSGKLYIGQSNISNALIYGDFNQRRVGINRADPATNLDVSGDMRVTRWMTVGFPGTYSPQGVVDANGYIYASLGFRAQSGSETLPGFTFINDTSTGFYQTGAGSFAITTQGNRRVDICGDTMYIYGNLKAFGSVNIGSIDTSSFVFSDGYVRDNAINPSTDISRAGVRTTTVDVSSLLQTINGMIRVGPRAAPTVDISGSSIRAAQVYATTFAQSPLFHDAAGTFDLSGGNLRVNSNIVVSNVLRTPAGAIRVGAITGSLTDISGGNIRTLGYVDLSTGTAARPSVGFVTDSSSGIHSGGTSIIAFDTSGIQRMTLSNGNLGIGKATPVVALEVVGDVSATTYNGPGGTAGAPHYTFSDDRTTGLFFPGTGQLGLTTGGTERMRISNAFVGIGTTAPTTALEISGGALRITSATGGPIVLSNGTINISGSTVVSSTGVFSNAAATSNSIGGIVLSNSNAIVGGFLRNALTPSQFDISGGNISNLGTHTSSNFIGTAAASNSIGGVTLSNGILSNATVVAATAVRNGLTPSVFDISTDISLSSGRFLGPLNASNNIGGVTLSNNNILYSASLIGSTPTNSNQIGGVTLSNNNIAYSGTLTGATANTSNSIGGITLSNGYVRATAASAATPSYAFSTDGTMGMYNAGANQLGFATAGTQRMTISNSNVGIGTGTPNANVEILGDVNTGTSLRVSTPDTGTLSSARLEFARSGTFGSDATTGWFLTSIALSNILTIASRTNGSSTTQLSFTPGPTGQILSFQNGSESTPSYSFFSNSNSGIYSPGSGQIGFVTSNSNRMILSNSNVGIGTTAPAGTLDVSGPTSQPGILVQNGGLFLRGRPSWGQLFLYNSTAQNSLVIEDISTGLRAVNNYPGITEAPLGWRMMTDSNYGSNKLVWQRVNGPGAGGVFPVVMTLDICGNVGIGTTNPNARLSINGVDTSSGILLTNNSANDATRAVGGGMVSNEIIGLSAPGLDAGQLRLSAGGGSNATSKTYIDMYGFNTRDMRLGTAGTERMRILSNGNVGIGTTAPAYALDVSGNVRIQGSLIYSVQSI